MPTVYIFPGQGSQKMGMGEELFPQFPDEINQASEILGYDIKALCLEGPQDKLNNTLYTQPALFVVNALAFLDKTKSGNKPDFVTGHSLGEYNALFASGVFDFATGLKLVKKRAELMSQAEEGGMAAVIGLSAEQVQSTLDTQDLNDIDLANINAPTQVVISGPSSRVSAANSVFEQAGAMMVIPLNVSGAFHSRYMKAAQSEFADFIAQFSWNDLTIPVIANYTAKPYEQANITENLVEQLTNSVRWVESIQYLKQQAENMEFEEVGPGNVLTGLIRKIN